MKTTKVTKIYTESSESEPKWLFLLKKILIKLFTKKCCRE